MTVSITVVSISTECHNANLKIFYCYAECHFAEFCSTKQCSQKFYNVFACLPLSQCCHLFVVAPEDIFI
jgi:hypothetical protein